MGTIFSLAVLGSIIGTQAAPPAEALLLGVRQGVPGNAFGVEPPEPLTTFWVDEYGFAEVDKGLYLPREDGWWRVTHERVAKGDFSNEALVVWRLTRRKPGPPPAADRSMFDYCTGPGDGCFMSSGMTLLFVGQDHIATLDSEHWRGGGSPTHLNTLAMRPLAPTTQFQSREEGLPIGGVLGAKTAAEFTRAANQAADEYGGKVLDYTWALARSQGRWVVRGGVMFAGRNAAHTEFFTIPGVKTGAFVPNQKPTDGWYDLEGKHPGLYDAVASPSGRLQVLVFADRMELWVDGALKDARPRADLGVVMTRWTKGAQIDQWRRMLIAEPSIR
ncbi:MAG: hypothetical protein ACI9WU_002949 [Myxococcota bacterium]|jgi:hypothetical protein